MGSFETQDIVKDPAKERVVTELAELNDKIVKLTAFVYGDKILDMGLSRRMLHLLRQQLHAMHEYASILQERLAIWGKSDEELKAIEAIAY